MANKFKAVLVPGPEYKKIKVVEDAFKEFFSEQFTYMRIAKTNGEAWTANDGWEIIHVLVNGRSIATFVNTNEIHVTELRFVEHLVGLANYLAEVLGHDIKVTTI